MGNKSRQYNFKLTEEELKALKTRAEQETFSCSAFIRMCVCKELGISADEACFSRSELKPEDKQELQINSAVIDTLRTQIQVLERLVLKLDRDVSELVSHQRNDSQANSMVNKAHERSIVESRNHLDVQTQKSDEELILGSALNDELVSIDGAGLMRESAALVADSLSPFSDTGGDCANTPASKFQNRITSAQKASLIELVHSDPPAHQSSWSNRSLAEEMLKRSYVAAISYETVRRILKDHNIDLKALAKEQYQ